MEYYNHEGKLVSYNQSESKESMNGGCSTLYVFDNYIYKRYLIFVPKENRVNFDIFNVLNKIDNRHLLKIKELLIEKEKYDINKTSKENFSKTPPDAYIMPILKRDNSNIFDRKVEFILEMLSEIEELIEIITNEHILLQDIKLSNVIVEENNIVLIDWDKYKFVSYELSRILSANQYQVIILFIALLTHNCESFAQKRIIMGLFDNISVGKESLAPQLKRSLNGCQTVREYIYKH
ncbi:MAG: hypothetical protein J1F35_00195 [Erysipelotrichales bacterium]|nr:hypothetical protein [Erysipelotrichales bacterium]